MRLKEEHRIVLTIEKSRFIACASPCFTEEEAREYISQIRKEFADATHVCTAYAIGKGNAIQRSSDNHEPSGTAGIPMLQAILHSGIENVCVCTVRYFGGIKLGAGGLIRAYSASVTYVLKEAEKLQEVPVDEYLLVYPYDLSGIFDTWLRTNTEVLSFDYDEKISCIFQTQDTEIMQKIQNLSRGKVLPVLRCHTVKEMPVSAESSAD